MQKNKSNVTVLSNIDKPASLSMLETAINKGLDPGKLLKFYELHERYEASQAKKEYVIAMAAFRAKCPIINRTKQGHNSKYAGLAESIEQVKTIMSDCGLSHSWRVDQKDSEIKVTCILTHVCGHSEQTTLSAEKDSSGNKSQIQAIASTVSYLERYTFYAITGMTSSEMDDDGAYALKAKADQIKDAVNKHSTTINTICLAIAENDLYKANEAFDELTNDDRASIRISPSKAIELGIDAPFTTAQLSVMKSDEWAIERRKFFKDKEISSDEVG